MEIKEIETLLNDALQAPEDDALRAKYGEAIADYLKDNKSSDEILSIVIRGIDLDRAANYYDFLEGASKNDLQSIWKQVRQNKDIKESAGDNAIKFLTGMLTMAFMKAGNMESQCGNIITLLVALINSDQKPVQEKIYGPILLDYVFDELDPKAPFPKWETIKASEKIDKQFSEMVLKITAASDEEKYKAVRQWASRGIRYAEEQSKKKAIEAKIPKSRIDDLKAILDHYQAVEKQLRDGVYAAARLEDEIVGLHDQIASLQSDKRALEKQIHDLNTDIEAKQQQLDKAEKEVGERAAINEAFGALKKNDESALLKDIANELRAEYQDFAETATDEMDVQLGEIYREKLKNIFKILNKKGITME